MTILKKFSVLKIYTIFVIVLFYFMICQIYHDNWFLEALNKYKINEFALLLFLFYMLIIQRLMYSKNTSSRMSRTNALILVSVFFGFCSVLLHEEGYDNIRRFSIAISSPVILYLCIFGFNQYKDNENIKNTLKFLFIFGVIFSLYVSYIMYPYRQGVISGIMIDTKYGIAEGFGISENIFLKWTLPGRSSTNFGPMLVPLIFVGLYFSKNTRRWRRYFYIGMTFFLFFVVVLTISRGAFVMLVIGMLYLFWKRWFKAKKGMKIFAFIPLIFVLILYLNPNILIRTLATVREISGLSHLNILREAGMEDVSNPRWIVLCDTLKHIFDRPLMGQGHTNFRTAQMSRVGITEHNNYLKVLAISGLIRFIPYMLFLLLLIFIYYKVFSRLSPEDPARDLGVLLGAGLICFLVYSNVAAAEFHFIWIWFAFVAAWTRNCENDLLHRRAVQ